MESQYEDLLGLLLDDIETSSLESFTDSDDSESNDEATECLTWYNVDKSYLNTFTFTGNANEKCVYSDEYPKNTAELKPIHVFNRLFDDNMINYIVTETNRNGQQLFNDVWINTNAKEMRVFIGIVMYMGLVSYHRVADYWNTHYLYRNTFVRSIMSCSRFKLLVYCLQIGDIQKCMNMLEHNFTREYIPGGDILAVGKVKRQCKVKQQQCFFKLCDPDGYTLKMTVFPTDSNEEENQVYDAVMQLVSNYIYKGYTIIATDDCISVRIATDLLNNCTHCIGTIKKKNNQLPMSVVKSKVSKGEIIGQTLKNGIVVAKWNNNKLFLSTKYGTEMVSSNETLKPRAIVDYEKGKQGINASNHLASRYFLPLRKTMGKQWQVFNYILDTAMVNSLILYRKLLERNIKIGMKQFKEEIIMDLLHIHFLSMSDYRDCRNRILKKKCNQCYIKYRKQGTKKALMKTKMVCTFCKMCQQWLCIDCFFMLHNYVYIDSTINR